MKKTINLFAIGFSTVLLILFDACKKISGPSGNNNANENGTTNSLCKEFEIKRTSQGGQDYIYTFNAVGQLQTYKSAEDKSTNNFSYSTTGELEKSPSIFLLVLQFPFFIFMNKHIIPKAYCLILIISQYLLYINTSKF